MLMALVAYMACVAALPVVALDAGHGGEQEGAPGICGIAEKDVTLAISKRVATLLAQSGQAAPYLVRPTDETLSLQHRSGRANAQRAALLVSIHANASQNPRVRGVETFFLSHRSDTSRLARLARRENDGIDLAAPPPIDPLQHILQGLSLDAAHTESQMLALRVQQTLQRRLHTRGRGVLQAPFMVLVGAQMAAILVEVGFITHPKECVLLSTPAYQSQVAQALSEGILAHVRRLASADSLASRQGGTAP